MLWGQSMMYGPSRPDFHGMQGPSFITSASKAEQSLLMRQLRDSRLSTTGPRVRLLRLPPLSGPNLLLKNETVVLSEGAGSTLAILQGDN